MTFNIGCIFSYIPRYIWKPLKALLWDETVGQDITFKLVTKYTFAVAVVLMCVSVSTEIKQIDCRSNGFNNDAGPKDKHFDDFCWNQYTFLVVKSIEPDIAKYVIAPGVSSYDRNSDDILIQRYYKHVWSIFLVAAFIAAAPYYIMHMKAVKKIEPYLDSNLIEFVYTSGGHQSFANYYTICKCLATAAPLLQIAMFCATIDSRMMFYGIDLTTGEGHVIMDSIFPKIAKCELRNHGGGGDIEIKSVQCEVQCQLPMNSYTQWTFCLYWFWLIIVFVAHSIHSKKSVYPSDRIESIYWCRRLYRN